MRLEKTKYQVSLLLSQVPVMQLLPGPILGVIRGLDPLPSFLYGEGTQARFFWSALLSLPLAAWQHFQHQHSIPLSLGVPLT